MKHNYHELFEFKPELTRSGDFFEFWEQTIKKVKEVPLNLRKKLIEYPIQTVEVYEIKFNGFDDTDLFGYVIKPKWTRGKVPVLIHFHGFNGNCGIPANYMHFTSMGIAVITFDIRGQRGKSGNHLKMSSGSTGLACNGILDEYEYYYRAVYGDCLKSLDLVEHFDFMDPNQIILDGVSQGGGLVMAVASLDDRPQLALADVPSYSYFQGRFDTSTGSVSTIVDYVKAFPETYSRVMKTLTYFDTMNMAQNVRAKVLASVGLKDHVCPAKFFFATYNRINAPKEIKIYDLGGHEGGHHNHLEYKLEFLKNNLKLTN